ncbi:unnamed protein product [Caretta caretta]
MEPNSPRKIQFTVPLLETHLDPEAAEQIRRRRPTPATLVLSSDQSSPEIDEDRLPNPLLKPGLSMSPRQRKKVPRTTPTMKELQMMVEHHLCKQQGEEEDASVESQEPHSPGCCHHGWSLRRATVLDQTGRKNRQELVQKAKTMEGQDCPQRSRVCIYNQRTPQASRLLQVTRWRSGPGSRARPQWSYGLTHQYTCQPSPEHPALIAGIPPFPSPSA